MFPASSRQPARSLFRPFQVVVLFGGAGRTSRNDPSAPAWKVTWRDARSIRRSSGAHPSRGREIITQREHRHKPQNEKTHRHFRGGFQHELRDGFNLTKATPQLKTQKAHALRRRPFGDLVISKMLRRSGRAGNQNQVAQRTHKTRGLPESEPPRHSDPSARRRKPYNHRHRCRAGRRGNDLYQPGNPGRIGRIGTRCVRRPHRTQELHHVGRVGRVTGTR